MDSNSSSNHQRRGVLKTLVSLLLTVVFVLGLSYLLRTFVLQTYGVPSGSMEQTIMTGDMVFAEKVSYLFRDPEPGDIVTFSDPEIPGRTLIKRCVATEGETITINDSGLLVVDGVVLNESYTSGRPTYPLTSDITYPYTVPEGMIWVMGDNRTSSQDSRYFGAVPVSSVIARGVLVYWPLDNFGLLD